MPQGDKGPLGQGGQRALLRTALVAGPRGEGGESPTLQPPAPLHKDNVPGLSIQIERPAVLPNAGTRTRVFTPVLVTAGALRPWQARLRPAGDFTLLDPGVCPGVPGDPRVAAGQRGSRVAGPTVGIAPRLCRAQAGSLRAQGRTTAGSVSPHLPGLGGHPLNFKTVASSP